ncbi:hypothetical protein ABIE18_003661 [Arthrobacter sp. 2762]
MANVSPDSSYLNQPTVSDTLRNYRPDRGMGLILGIHFDKDYNELFCWRYFSAQGEYSTCADVHLEFGPGVAVTTTWVVGRIGCEHSLPSNLRELPSNQNSIAKFQAPH